MFTRLAWHSWAKVILLPQPSKWLGLQAHSSMHNFTLSQVVWGLRAVSSGCCCLTTLREKPGGTAFTVAGLSSGGQWGTLSSGGISQGREAGKLSTGGFFYGEKRRWSLRISLLVCVYLSPFLRESLDHLLLDDLDQMSLFLSRLSSTI